MLTIQAKLVIALVLSLAFGGMWLGLSYYKDKAKTEEDRADMVQAGADLYRKAVEDQAKDIKEYQTKLDEKLNENSTLRDSVNANRKRLSIRAVCTATETPNTAATGTAEIIDPTVRSNIFDFRAKLILLEANYALCLKELN